MDGNIYLVIVNEENNGPIFDIMLVTENLRPKNIYPGVSDRKSLSDHNCIIDVTFLFILGLEGFYGPHRYLAVALRLQLNRGR